jgi:starch synthase (maltosyl-transferring)
VERLSRASQPPVPHRLVIEEVEPQIDGGRHPVKRVVGDRLRVGADLFMDGHSLIRARIRYRRPGERRWRHAPLRYHFDPDRWSGSVELDRIGLWAFSVEGWPDAWGSWCADLRKRIDAGQDLAPELLEGVALLRRAAARASGKARSRLEEAAAELESGARDGLAPDVTFSDDIAELAAGPLEDGELTRYERVLEVVVDRERARFGAWYELFPRSQAAKPGRHGTFADVERRLPALAELGFDVVYLPPIHPIGRSHRKGPNNTLGAGPGDPGSPWAIGAEEGGHTAVHPELGSLADFEHLVAAAESLGLEIALDYALQCSPDHPWVREHPGWFSQRLDGSIRYAENPPKKYQDIYPLDFWCEDREGLWRACRDVLLFWIERGVRIFRVDNPHTKPFAFWEWVIREVQARHPEVIFFAEAFTRPKRMLGLAKLGFTQSYSYYTWKNTSWELRDYLTELTRTRAVEFYRPNFFANTPDILHEYLQEGGPPAFRVRLLLAGTLSPSYGIYSGYELCENEPLREGSEEYLHSEKYEVRWRDWNAPGNLNEEIRRLNRMRRENPALQRFDNLAFLGSTNERILFFHKADPRGQLLVAANLDPHAVQESTVEVPLGALGLAEDRSFQVEDLLSGERYTWRGPRAYVRLDPALAPGHVLRLASPGPA